MRLSASSGLGLCCVKAFQSMSAFTRVHCCVRALLGGRSTSQRALPLFWLLLPLSLCLLNTQMQTNIYFGSKPGQAFRERGQRAAGLSRDCTSSCIMHLLGATATTLGQPRDEDTAKPCFLAFLLSNTSILDLYLSLDKFLKAWCKREPNECAVTEKSYAGTREC